MTIASTGNLKLDRQLDRWYPLIDIPQQLAMIGAIDKGRRFLVVPAGRRSGKTERAKRILAKQAMRNTNQKYFAAAPTQDQAKKIWYDDLCLLTLSVTHKRQPRVSPQPVIYLNNGSEIHIIGLDKPQRIEGVAWTGGVIDEIADVKGEALDANIMPALNTVDPRNPDYRAWCIFCGVPDGLNHYYRMAQYAETANDPDWELFHWESEEILPPDVIESAKRTMSAQQYRQEYKASFETATGRIYPDFTKDNTTEEEIQPHEAIWWMHDQNYTPLSSSIGVKRGDDLYLLDEIVLTSAVSRQSALEFVEKYKDHKNKTVWLFGDPAGRAGEKHGHASDYTAIKDVLREHGWTFKDRVARKHPAIKDRQNAVRAKICTADGHRSLFVNVTKAPWSWQGLATVQLQKGSTFQEDQTNQYQHITTAIGYCIAEIWPVNGSDVKPIKVGWAR